MTRRKLRGNFPRLSLAQLQELGIVVAVQRLDMAEAEIDWMERGQLQPPQKLACRRRRRRIRKIRRQLLNVHGHMLLLQSGARPKIARRPELESFIVQRVDRMTISAIAGQVRWKFGATAPSRATIGRYVARLRDIGLLR